MNRKSIEESREEMLKACIALFRERGACFTMDDVAASIHISKKTLYKMFDDRQSMFLRMVDYIFDGIKAEQELIYQNDSLSTADKLKALLTASPEAYETLDFSALYAIQKKNPLLYDKIRGRLESGWEPTLELIEKGKAEGIFKESTNPLLFKLIYEAAIESFLSRNNLHDAGINYRTALNETVDLLLHGITA